MRIGSRTSERRDARDVGADGLGAGVGATALADGVGSLGSRGRDVGFGRADGGRRRSARGLGARGRGLDLDGERQLSALDVAVVGGGPRPT